MRFSRIRFSIFEKLIIELFIMDSFMLNFSSSEEHNTEIATNISKLLEKTNGNMEELEERSCSSPQMFQG